MEVNGNEGEAEGEGEGVSMRIDSHHHLWDMKGAPREWLSAAGLEPIKKNFTMEDYRDECSAARIDSSILVQSSSSYEELNEMFDVAETEKMITGVVAWIDMSAPDSIEILEKSLDLPGSKKLVGIRDGAQGRADTNWLSSAQVVSNIRKLARFDLPFDLLVDPPHLRASVELVQKLPDNFFVLDHIGKPNIANGEISAWESIIKELATPDNVFCKVSGLVTEANWHSWENSDFKPYFEVVLEAFGADRLMYGSDWPVCKLAANYEEVVELAEYLISDLSETEKAKFGGQNAEEAYSLQ